MNRIAVSLAAAFLVLCPVARCLAADRAASGAAAWDVRLRALESMRAGDQEGSLEWHAEAITANPWDGALRERYGLAALATGRFDEAAGAFEACRALGYRWLEATYNLACARARAGRIDAALDALDEAYAEGYADDDLVARDHDLDPLRASPRFAEITGMLPGPGGTRAERWRADLEVLDRRLRRLHFDLFHTLAEEEYDRRLAALREQADGGSDDELRWGIQRLLAAIGDGHTTVVPEWFLAHHLGGATRPYARYPVRFWWYPGGLALRDVPRDHPGWAGRRVTAIGGVPAEEALARVLEFCSRDNEVGARWVATNVLSMPSAMEVAGLAEPDGGLALTLDGGTERIVVRAVTGEPAFHTLGEAAAGGMPKRLRGTDRHFGFETRGDGIGVLQYNVVRNAEDETIAAFAERIRPALASLDVLVVDLRHNHGGSGHLSMPLLTAIAAAPVNAPGRLWVLIGRETFSAGMTFATDLETHTAARFVGEPTGSRPNFIGESSLFRLPYSGLTISCSSRWFQGTSSLDRRRWIAPQVPAETTLEDDREDRDPAMEAVLTIVAADRPHAGGGKPRGGS